MTGFSNKTATTTRLQKLSIPRRYPRTFGTEQFPGPILKPLEPQSGSESRSEGHKNLSHSYSRVINLNQPHPNPGLLDNLATLSAKPYAGAIASGAFVLATFIVAIVSYSSNLFAIVIAMGALGGVVHEVAQSKGTIVFPRPDLNGDYYLGALYGLVAGGIAGLILAQGVPASASATTQLVSEAFFAGLGLKGFSEAVTPNRPRGRPPPQP